MLAYIKIDVDRYAEFMNDQYRRLAVFVDRPSPGSFLWIILESTEDPAVWLDLETGDEKFDSWSEAYEAGNSALLSYVEDPAAGPLAAALDGFDSEEE
ncbi:hypothetical protein BH11PSE13_BH11PSE13_36950 [soil metagenome]